VNIVVNGEARHVDDGSTLAELVATLGRDPARPGVAVAVDEEVVPRRTWEQRRLRDGDRVEVVAAVQGGCT
jgi:sulfur carrier protein